MALALWLIGLLGMIIAAAAAAGRGRARPNDVATRAMIAVAAGGYVAIVAGAVWTWGGTAADEGRAARIHDGARVELTLGGLHVATAPVTIGHGDAAAIRLAGDGASEIARVEVDRGATPPIVHVRGDVIV